MTIMFCLWFIYFNYSIKKKFEFQICQKAIAERLASAAISDCDLLESGNKEVLMCQVEQLQTRLDHVRSQMAVLELMFEQSAAQTDK